MRGLRNILFKDRLEEAVGVIASLSVESHMPRENILSLDNLNPNMVQDNVVKACPFSIPTSLPLLPLSLAVIIVYINRQKLVLNSYWKH